MRFGGYVGLGLNIHRAGFTRLPGVPNCCREFTGGSSWAGEFGILFDYPFSSSFALHTRLGYTGLGAELIESETTTIILDAEPAPARFEHRLDAAIAAIELAPTLAWRPVAPLRFRLGPTLDYILSATYDQSEVLVEPETIGVFENGRRTRNEFDGDIPERASLLFGATAGVGIELPLTSDRSLIATPEIRYARGFANLLSDSLWAIDRLMLSVEVAFRRVEESDNVIVDIPPPVDTIATPSDTVPALVALDTLTPAIELVGVDENGVETPTALLRVEEFISTNMRPLLPYIFFDSTSAVIPNRYSQLPPLASGGTTDRFAVEKLHSVPVLPTYHHILNIVGKRLLTHPEATLTITGTNDGAAEMAEGLGVRLSRKRAEAVRDYLVSVWGIDTSRLTLAARNLTVIPSNVDDPDGVVENRRVELASETWQILEPIVSHDTLRVTNPPTLRLRPSVAGDAEVASWEIRIAQSDRTLRTFTGTGPLPERIDWHLLDEQLTVPTAVTPVTTELIVTESSARRAQAAPDTLPVEILSVSEKRRERRDDKYIDRYSLILFDFDKAEFTAANRQIATFIKERLSPGSTVSITGYTDRIGETEHNADLSLRRAEETVRELGLEAAIVTGLGETKQLHTNDLPEGRFYSRTVTIVVETPIEEGSRE